MFFSGEAGSTQETCAPAPSNKRWAAANCFRDAKEQQLIEISYRGTHKEILLAYKHTDIRPTSFFFKTNISLCFCLCRCLCIVCLLCPSWADCQTLFLITSYQAKLFLIAQKSGKAFAWLSGQSSWCLAWQHHTSSAMYLPVYLYGAWSASYRFDVKYIALLELTLSS